MILVQLFCAKFVLCLCDFSHFIVNRTLATVEELRSLMQQGVAETPIFNAYLLKANLDDYEAEVRVSAH